MSNVIKFSNAEIASLQVKTASNGKQYIIVAVSDPRYSGEYLAFSLPN